jgi:hypothetical protein
MVLVLWWSFVMAFIYKYAQTVINLFKRYDPAILDDDDDGLVGHASFSDNEEEEEEDEEVDDPMRDFYEETTLSPEWLALSEEEKRERLDKELDEYMSKSKPKHE